MADYGIVLVTASSADEAKAIAKTLVEERLAACVSLTPVRSIYTWQGNIEEDEEWQLVIKTDLMQFDRLASRVCQLHRYDVPEIIAVPIVNGSAAYLDWIGEQCQSTD
ncbi:Periplasmic divalent cation tolerance protein cutA [Geitlerinema sp. FC II]|nr:Periplasmic divalent cation tolerance protein cutA [Geitlerinema sp. FC II]